LSIDLSDLRGYQYHSGVMFAAYVDKLPQPIARGGRYDHVGQAFGRPRPATGFSLDLLTLANLSPIKVRKPVIAAPWIDDCCFGVPLLHNCAIVVKSLFRYWLEERSSLLSMSATVN
jgi:hypothetical protein